MSDHPLFQLTLVRFREFLREPEALFWVFGFPLLLAAGLGLAFRNTPAEVLTVGVVGTDLTAFEQRAPRSRSSRSLPSTKACVRCARAKSRCSSSAPRTAPSLYRYDDTNPEGRDARMRADMAVQRAPAGWTPWPRRTSSCASRDRATSTSSFRGCSA